MATDLYSQRILQRTTVDLTFYGRIGGTPYREPNTIEFVSDGPGGQTRSPSHWIVGDYVRLEPEWQYAAPVLAPVANQTVDELTPLVVEPDGDGHDACLRTPTYELVSGPGDVCECGAWNWTPNGKCRGPGCTRVTVSVKGQTACREERTKTFSDRQ